jgi:hypothetical protein
MVPPEIYRRCWSLLIYRELLNDQVGQAFLALLQAETEESRGLAYSAWFTALANRRQGWHDYLIDRLLTVETVFSQQPDLGAAALVRAVQHDLKILQALHGWGSQAIADWVGAPAWVDRLSQPTTPRQVAIAALHDQLAATSDWDSAIADLAAFHQRFGSGIFAEYQAFRWQRGELIAIAHPDPVQADQLIGYETQREAIFRNTEFLLAGLPALHILLYGSRGSGKSSLIKSLLHRYDNLRLLEVGKAELCDLPLIVEQLRHLPQKFVIFVDDLSFEEDDDAFKALKVVLEGNLTARPKNLAVYATTNRRHLVREYFEERPRPKDADEIHHWDTVQEKLSFSDRFGLTLTFEPADQPTYLKMVHHLAAQAGIALEPQELEFKALQWATRHNGRSGRTARQFVDFLVADLTLEPRHAL